MSISRLDLTRWKGWVLPAHARSLSDEEEELLDDEESRVLLVESAIFLLLPPLLRLLLLKVEGLKLVDYSDPV